MKQKKSIALKPNYYSADRQATVTTPPDQQDVSPIDMVSGAVDEMMDLIQKDVGLQDKTDKTR